MYLDELHGVKMGLHRDDKIACYSTLFPVNEKMDFPPKDVPPCPKTPTSNEELI